MGQDPRRDLIAGLTVGVVALPLALAFGATSGMGAGAGLITAIVAGVLAAIFGGSNLQVSGPTGAMTVVLVPIIATYGPDGVLVVGLLAGIILVGMAIGGMGRFVQFIPMPVIEGFTVGIAVIIGLQQIPAALGVTAHGERVMAVALDAVVTWVASPQVWPLVLSAGVMFIMLAGSRLRSPIPMSLVGIVLATLAAEVLNLPVARIGDLPRSLPLPQLPAMDTAMIRVLFVPAFAVAALAALESLLSATVADGMSGRDRHDPDRELFGQGIANIASPLFGGLPATAAIARTAVNVRTGARSRLASITHSVVLVVVVLALAPVVATIPLAALSGVLLATAVRMVEVSRIKVLLHTTHRDATDFAATAVATVALDLVTAVILGVVIAGLLALRAMAASTTIGEIPLAEAGAPGGLADEPLYDPHIIAYRIEGSLFFGAAHEALLGVADVADLRVVILRLSRVSTLDATGATVLHDTVQQLRRRGVVVLLSGVKDPHWKVLDILGVTELIGGEEHVFVDTRSAVEHARLHVSGVAVH
ncbi:MAG: SulP family inorganic anion transporter [Candidatus Nanopelagicales bacterium]